jgi:gluconokinase
MGATCILGLDLGTTHVKSIALSRRGEVLASATRPVETVMPQPGRAEQDAEAVWAAAAGTLRETAAALAPGSIEALALSGAMHTCLPVAADDSPLTPALTWADQRAAETCRRLRAGAELAGLYRRTGCPLQAIYHIPKLRWWGEQAPAVAHRTARFVALKDFVLHRLTGTWAADPSTWSATGLLDIRRCLWDEEALALAGIGPDRLPPLASPFDRAGPLTAAAARAAGLPSGLPVIVGASDGALANLGCGTLTPGQVVISVGTSGAIRQWVSEPRLDEAQRTWCYLLAEGRWFAGGAINNAGLAVQWIRDLCYADEAPTGGYERLFAEAAQAPPGAGGLRCLPFFAGERSPYWRAEARAAFLGLGWEHGRRHLARAVLEAVALRLADVWEALAPAPVSEPARLTGGIARSPFWAQLACDALGVELAVTEAADASAVGAALLAQAALEPAVRLETLTARIRPGPRWRPDPARHETYRRMLEEFRGLYRRFIDNPSGRGYSDGA